MKTLHDFKIFFWDFDGVIINSDNIRIKGFKNSLEDYNSNDVNSLLIFHKNNGGLSRYVKFRFFFEKILNQPLNEEKFQKLLLKYSKFCQKNLMNKKLLISEVIQYIKENYNNKIFHIASGSDNQELNELCNGMEISSYFKSINGSPEPKKEIIKRIIKENNYLKKNICLIGDSINDYQAAAFNKIFFFGYNNLELKKIKNSNYLNNF
jgi:phosphoglycolate phosphatase-like HAD superfamily hydrolase